MGNVENLIRLAKHLKEWIDKIKTTIVPWIVRTQKTNKQIKIKNCFTQQLKYRTKRDSNSARRKN